MDRDGLHQVLDQHPPFPGGGLRPDFIEVERGEDPSHFLEPLGQLIPTSFLVGDLGALVLQGADLDGDACLFVGEFVGGNSDLTLTDADRLRDVQANRFRRGNVFKTERTDGSESERANYTHRSDPGDHYKPSMWPRPCRHRA